MSESESSTYDLSSAGEGSDAEQFESGIGFLDATQFLAKAVHPYSARYRDELCLRVGEIVDVLSTDPKVSGNFSWWTGRLNGLIGVFPASSVRPCSTPPSTPPPAVRCGSPHTSTLTRLQGMEEYPQRIPMREIDKKGIVGRGGFGHVYKAIWRGEEVALKMSRLSTEDKVAAMEEVLAEASRFAFLKHRNICTLLGVCMDYPEVGIVMQYAQGGSLSKTVHSASIQLPVAVALDWALQIAEGMHYLHHGISKPLVHRDLKSNNILLLREVDPLNLEGNTPLITDFGLAREIQHTTHMSGAGTFAWMSPEVIRTSVYSKASDVWSFGVVVWELLTRELPYNGMDLYAVAWGVGSGKLSLPIPDAAPELLRSLLDACWDRDPHMRPDFGDIIAKLHDLQRSKFASINPDAFLTLQQSWKEEVRVKFEEFKKKEEELQAQEQSLEKLKLQLDQWDEVLREKEKKLKEWEQRLQQSPPEPPRKKPSKLNKFVKLLKQKSKTKRRSYHGVPYFPDSQPQTVPKTQSLHRQSHPSFTSYENPAYDSSGSFSRGNSFTSSTSTLTSSVSPNARRRCKPRSNSDASDPYEGAASVRPRVNSDSRKGDMARQRSEPSDHPIQSHYNLSHYFPARPRPTNLAPRAFKHKSFHLLSPNSPMTTVSRLSLDDSGKGSDTASPMTKYPSGDLIHLHSPTESQRRTLTGTVSCDCLVTGLDNGPRPKNLPSPSSCSVGSNDSAYAGHGTGSDNSPYSQSPVQTPKGLSLPRPRANHLSRSIILPAHTPPPPPRPENMDFQNLGIRSAPTSRPTSRPTTPKAFRPESHPLLMSYPSESSLPDPDSPLQSPKTPIVPSSAFSKMFLIDTPADVTDSMPPLIVLPPQEPTVSDIVREFDNIYRH